MSNDWPLSTICWYAVFIWFASSLFSQMVYIGINGVPYDVDVMLDSIGPYAWLIISLEIMCWIMIGFHFVMKIVKRIGTDLEKTPSRESLVPQS